MASENGQNGVGLQLCLLGKLTVVRHGRTLDLRSSRKLQALLAYLVLTPRATTRSHLTQLLWDTATDPRGELRWYLSKLRSIISAEYIVCDHDAVRIDLKDSFVDALEVERSAAAIGRLTFEQARALLALFPGDFLEGMHVERCSQFTNWLLSQRRHFHARRVALHARLVQVAPEDEVLKHTEEWLRIAPFEVRAHEYLWRTLVRHGRLSESEEHLEAAISMFTAEGLDSAALVNAWRAALPESKPVRRMVIRHDDAQAYDHYLLGRQHLARMMQQGLEASRKAFVAAIRCDANYAPAWAGLATVDACLAEWFDAGQGIRTHAEYASRRALQLAPQLAEAHVARGLTRSLSKHYEEATCEFEEAIRLNPHLFDAYYYFARTAFSTGHMARAAELFGAAMELRVDDFQSAMFLAMSRRALGQESAARDAVRVGIRRAEQILLLNPHDGRALSLGAGALVDDEQTERALQWSRSALELYADDTSALVNVACVHARVGQADEALNLLERVFARGCGKRDWVENDPDYDSLRAEPRFQRLLSGLI